MRNFTAIFADLTPEEVAEVMANPKCRYGSHSDLAAERDALGKDLAASQAREAKLREALQTFIDEHEECTDPDDWTAFMCSYDAVHEADNALDMPTDDTALKELLAEGQAREAKLRELLTQFELWESYDDPETPIKDALARIGSDETALKEAIKQAKREALLEAAENDVFEHAMAHGFTVADRLRKMAEELK